MTYVRTAKDWYIHSMEIRVVMSTISTRYFPLENGLRQWYTSCTFSFLRYGARVGEMKILIPVLAIILGIINIYIGMKNS